MQNGLGLNSYNFQAIIALNDHLKVLSKLDDIFNYLASHFSANFDLPRFSVSINNHDLFVSFDETEQNLKSKDFLIQLNCDEELKVTFFYTPNQKESIDNSLEILKVTFNVVSQTIYNKYLEFKLKEISLKDTLTGLYNRQYVDEYLKTMLPLSSRERKKMAFLKVGIDHFKAVIDEFDYTIGDRVLQELATSLEGSVRESDIIARIEGDEFLIILHNVMNEDNAIKVAQKVIDNFKDTRVVVNEQTNQTLMKTICTGISMFPDDADKVEEIFRSSDIALYEARNKGRSQLFKFKKEDTNTIDLF